MARPIGYAIVLGVATGGFFDGILLHQILQWHHLFSLVPGIADLKTQILWDGAFHALMYALAALGLWGLWRAHARGALPGRVRLHGALLVGAGLWHVTDSIMSHWILGIHRIKVDSPDPLFWDLAWFVAFGLVPLGLGWAMLRRNGGDGPPPRAKGRAAAAGLAVLTLATGGAGYWALQPPSGAPQTAVVFRAALSEAEKRAALDALGGRILWSDPEMAVVVTDIPAGNRWRLYARGALLVGGAGVPAGCLAWSRV